MGDVLLITALIRFLLALIAAVFAARGRYWWLMATALLGAFVALTSVIGVAREVTLALAVPIYALLAFHALDITRQRHPRR